MNILKKAPRQAAKGGAEPCTDLLERPSSDTPVTEPPAGAVSEASFRLLHVSSYRLASSVYFATHRTVV